MTCTDHEVPEAEGRVHLGDDEIGIVRSTSGDSGLFITTL